MIFMGKSMVSGEDFPLNQPIETRCHGESRHVQVPKGPFCRRRSHSRSKSRQLGEKKKSSGDHRKRSNQELYNGDHKISNSTSIN